MGKFLSFLSFMLISNLAIHAQSWSQLGTGSAGLNAIGDIYTICADNHGNVYAAGWFPDDTTYTASSVYKWNGSEWTELGHGSTALNVGVDFEIDAIYADTSGNVYAGATRQNPDFSYQYFVSKWDGASWSQLGTGADALYSMDRIQSITGDRYGNIYAAGAFFEGGTYGHHGYVAKWDGASWSEVGTGANRLNANGGINTLFIDSANNILAAGVFTDDSVSDTSGYLYVAKWDGTTWNEIGTGICPAFMNEYQVFSIVEDTVGNVYAAGIIGIGIGFGGNVAKWDGSSWHEIGTGSAALHPNGTPFSLCLDKFGNLYAAGDFTDTSVMVPMGAAAFGDYSDHPHYVAKWDGTSWSKLGTGSNALYANSSIETICTDHEGNVFAAGNFTDTTITFRQILDEPSPDTFYWHGREVARYGNSFSTAVASINRNANFTLYPNPAHNSLALQSEDKISEVSISDLLGRTLLTENYNNVELITIDVSLLTPGTYFIKVNDAEIRKFTKS